MSVTLALSVDGLTAMSAWMAGLAIVALVLVGWRKPARAQAKPPRAALDPPRAAVPVDHVDAHPYRRPGPLRRLAAAVASGGLAIVTGAVLAIVASYVAAWAVITVTDMLKR